MSKYTLQLGVVIDGICKKKTPSRTYNEISQSIDYAIPTIFYPVTFWNTSDAGYRNTLCRKILYHYYNDEIAYETVALWIQALNVRMAEIMPYYNNLYDIEKKKFDPFQTADYKRVTEDKRDTKDNNKSTGKVESSTEQTAKDTDQFTKYDLYADTPGNGLQGMEGEAWDDKYYLTNATKQTNDESKQTSGKSYGTTNETKNDDRTINETGTTTETITGKDGSVSYSKLFTEYRESLINIDMMIIDELKDLFMGVW